MTCALFAALVLLADAGASRGASARTDLYGDPLPPGAVARLGTIRLRHADAEVRFSKDGKQLISCDRDGEVRTWKVATGELVRRKRFSWKDQEDERPLVVVVSPDGALAAVWGGNGDSIQLYDTNTGKERGRIPCFRNTISYRRMRFSADGRLLAVQAQEEKSTLVRIDILDVAALKTCRTLSLLDVDLSSMAFTSDGNRMAGIAEIRDKVVHLFLWDTTSGKLLHTRKDLRRIDPDSLAFSPDGKMLALGCYDDAVVRLLAADTLKDKSRLQVPATVSFDFANNPIFSPDGKRLAAFGGTCRVPGRSFVVCRPQEVFLWDLPEGKNPRRLPAYDGTQLRFSPDGEMLTYRGESEIRLWDTASGQRLHPPPSGHDHLVKTLAVSPDGKTVASGDLTPTILLWDTATSRPLRAMRGDDDWTHACLFSPDGKRVISAGVVGTFQVWDAASGKELRRFEIDWPERGLVDLHAVGISADGKRLAAIASGGQRSHAARTLIWDIATGKQCSQQPYQLEERTLGKTALLWLSKTHAAFAPDGASMTVWLGKQVGIEEIATNSLLATLPQGVGDPLVFSPDGRLVAAAILQPKSDPSDGDDELGVALIEAASGGELWRMKIDGFRHAAFAPDGRTLVVVDVKNLSVWNAFTGERLHKMAWPESVLNHQGEPNIHSLVVLPGGRAATGMSEGDILIWDLDLACWPVHKVVGELGREKLDALWTDLAGDARKAYRAIDTLSAAPAEAAPFLKDHLRPVEVDAKRIDKLLADLDGDSFALREAACRELTQLSDRAEPILQRVLEGRPSPEMRRRLRAILAEPRRPPTDALRTLRAIAVLERIGTPEARRVLEKLSGGTPARETREAKAALERLKRLTD
jgi:WD40 repeat protein